MGTRAGIGILLGLFLLLLPAANAQDFKKWEPTLREYKNWIEAVGAGGARFWIRLDSTRRPHQLYVGEGFDLADHEGRERFVEIFSHHLAGHPEKYMLIDLYDGATGVQIGEFGWGGYRLYSNYRELKKEGSGEPTPPDPSPSKLTIR